MSCPLRKTGGSGYDKSCDPELAKRNKEALEKLKAQRAAQDASLSFPSTSTSASTQKSKSVTPVLPSTPQPQRYLMKGD